MCGAFIIKYLISSVDKKPEGFARKSNRGRRREKILFHTKRTNISANTSCENEWIKTIWDGHRLCFQPIGIHDKAHKQAGYTFNTNTLHAFSQFCLWGKRKNLFLGTYGCSQKQEEKHAMKGKRNIAHQESSKLCKPDHDLKVSYFVYWRALCCI